MMEAQRGMRDADMEKMMAIEEELSRLDTPEPAASAGGHRVKRVSLVVPPSPPAKDVEEKLTFPARPNPLRVNPVDEPRPMTSSSRRLSFSTIATFKRPIKFGKGKYANVELVPQPSDDEDDPLVRGGPGRRPRRRAFPLTLGRTGRFGRRNSTTRRCWWWWPWRA